MLHQIIGNCELQNFSQHYEVVFDGGNTQVSFFQSVDEDTDLCVGDGVNFLFTEHGEDVSLVSGQVSSMDGFGRCFFD